MEKLKIKIEQPKQEGLEHVYTDKDGNAFYMYKLSHLPHTRYVFLQGTLNQLALGIEAKQLSTILDKIANDGLRLSQNTNIAEYQKTLLYDVENIKQRTRNILQMDLLLQASLCLVVLEGEPNEYSERWNGKKLTLWNNDSDAKFFFAHKALVTITGLQNISLEELKAFQLGSLKNQY